MKGREENPQPAVTAPQDRFVEPASSDRLRAVIVKWRETADIWAHQLELETGDLRGPGIMQRPPQPGRSGIQNWITWLRSCANQVEQAMQANGESAKALQDDPVEPT